MKMDLDVPYRLSRGVLGLDAGGRREYIQYSEGLQKAHLLYIQRVQHDPISGSEASKPLVGTSGKVLPSRRVR